LKAKHRRILPALADQLMKAVRRELETPSGHTVYFCVGKQPGSPLQIFRQWPRDPEILGLVSLGPGLVIDCDETYLSETTVAALAGLQRQCVDGKYLKPGSKVYTKSKHSNVTLPRPRRRKATSDELRQRPCANCGADGIGKYKETTGRCCACQQYWRHHQAERPAVLWGNKRRVAYANLENK
jgi:hypothetical protein